MDENFRRDYNVDDYKNEDDPRFDFARRDCIFAQVLYFSTLIIGFALAYALCPDDASQLTYVFGFPMWFVAGAAVFAIAPIIAIVYFLKSRRFSLDPKASLEEVND